MRDYKEVVANPKEWFLERTSISRCLCVGPCFFQFLSVVPTSTQSDIVVKVYDGQNTSGDLKLTVKCLYSHNPIPLPHPAYFRRGLYVDLTTNAAEATLQYMPLKD